MKDLEKMLMAKKGKSALSPEEADAKMEVLRELLDMATQAMGSKVKGGMDEMKKVSVMAPDQASLEKGLEMAKDVAATDPEESPEHELTESPKEEALEQLAGKDDEDDSEDSIFASKKPMKKKPSVSILGDEE